MSSRTSLILAVVAVLAVAAVSVPSGLAVASDGPSAPGDEPVLLVHGFADTKDTPWWTTMENRLEQEGYADSEVYVLDLGAALTTVDSPEDYAEEVCTKVREVARRHNSDVDVVGHSMGGLDARWCIEKLDGARHVDDLVTIGTPHQGTYAAYLAYITPGARDMVPNSDFLDRLNDGQLAEGVEYTAVWSDWDEAVAPDEYARIPGDERRSVESADNVFVNNVFHLQLVWSERSFDAFVHRLD